MAKKNRQAAAEWRAEDARQARYAPGIYTVQVAADLRGPVEMAGDDATESLLARLTTLGLEYETHVETFVWSDSPGTFRASLYADVRAVLPADDPDQAIDRLVHLIGLTGLEYETHGDGSAFLDETRSRTPDPRHLEMFGIT